MKSEVNEEFFLEVGKKFPCITSLNVNLARISRWKIGGIAKCIVSPRYVDELEEVVQYFRDNAVRFIVIGSTTNLLFSDLGLNVPCIRITSAMSNITIGENTIIAEAGAWVPCFAKRMMKAGLAGFEHIIGIPGSLGGLVFMNGGSQRRSISEAVLSVKSISHNGVKVVRRVDECLFGYRKSIFQDVDEIITEVSFSFVGQCEASSIRAEMLNILKERRLKFPQKEPNCGSVFKSNPDMYETYGPPAAVIDRLGLKGFSYGNAMISKKHANFIVNIGNCRSSDVIELVARVRQLVWKDTGYLLSSEAFYVSVDGDFVSLDQACNFI